jgi:hypothetical protein
VLVDTVTPYQAISLFGTVINSAVSRISKNGRNYTAFGMSIIYDRNWQEFSYNVVARGEQGHFAKSLQKGTRIKLVIQAQSNLTTLPVSRYSPQPSCDRFIRSRGGTGIEHRRRQLVADACFSIDLALKLLQSGQNRFEGGRLTKEHILHGAVISFERRKLAIGRA